MHAEELTAKWNRVTSPRVRDAWLDREICGHEIVWEKGQPWRVVRENGGPNRHEPVPHWSTSRSEAKRLGHLVHPRPPLGGEAPDEICLKLLLRHLQTKGGLWR